MDTLLPYPSRTSPGKTQLEWSFLPFRFLRFDDDTVLLTNMVGEHVFVTNEHFDQLMAKELSDTLVTRRLRGKHIIRLVDEAVPLQLLAMKARTRYTRLPELTGLHIFVVTLRCEHSCHYCQVSRQSSNKTAFDMTNETAMNALAMVFRSPSQNIKIEFQGGEPLLNFPMIEAVVEKAEQLNERYGRNLSFVIATNLALLDDSVMRFCAEHDVFLSTSLDGPEDLHNRNRPRLGGDSWRRTIDGIRRIREELGPDRVSALMTTSEGSLNRVREIIDCYAEHGLLEVFLRPISPYGLAIKTKSHAAYDAERWLEFYEDGLDYILELNARGTPMVERYAAIILKKMLTNDDPGYVDLTSPAGIGIGALVYNYDGDVYASDEGRMLAEMGDKTFRLGSVLTDDYAQIIGNDTLLDALEESFAFSAPMCSDCAYEPYCGSDPVYHHTMVGDFVGRKPESAFCQRNMGVFAMLLRRYRERFEARDLFRSWAAS